MMTPQEKALLDSLSQEISAAAAQPRDPEVEAYLADMAARQPHALYVLAQSVLLQQQALQAQQQKIQDLQHQLSAAAPAPSFLGGHAASIVPQVPPPATANASKWGQTSAPPPQWGQSAGAPMPPSAYSPAMPSSPWGAPTQNSGFLSGALGTAAGVAGGVLLADAIGSMFSHHQNTASFMAPASSDGVMDQLSSSFEHSGNDVVSDQSDSFSGADTYMDSGGSDFDQA
jgi:hypothetical protein